MKESQRGALSGVHGPVSRLFQVSSEYAVAIETALGGAMQGEFGGEHRAGCEGYPAFKAAGQRTGPFCPCPLLETC